MLQESHKIDGNEAKRDLDSQEMLCVIFDYAAKIANERKLDNQLLLLADMGRELVVSDRCSVWLLDRKRSELYTRVAHGTPPLRLPVTAGLVGYAVSKGEPVFINDVYTNEEFKDVLQSGAIATDRITGYRTKSLMVIPFCNSEGEIIGAYQAVNKLTREAQFSQRDVEHLCLAASYAGKALESALLTNEIEETQKEILLTMGAIGESRSRETGNHVKRVAEDSYLLGLVPA